MLKNANIILIRHGEKPDNALDIDLNIAGQARAMAYIIYFKHLQLGTKDIKLTHLFATAQSAHSNRSYLTIEPLARELNLQINNHFTDSEQDIVALVSYLQSDPQFNEANILICWHHEKLLEIAKALGAAPHTLPTDWPDKIYGWLIHLEFDNQSKLIASTVVEQKLMYDDHNY